MFLLVSIFWLIRETKVILFWLYLWQLKEYHIGRFIDHFQTEKGKELFFNRPFIFKIFLLFYLLILGFYPKLFFSFNFYNWIILILIIFYFFESAKFFLSIFRKQTKKPVLTKKSITLILANLSFVAFFLFYLYKITSPFFYWLEIALGLLFFDILTPIVVSAIVLFFQPLAVWGRNRIIQRAKEKRGEFNNLFVIGITGSYGKTSTKEFLATILSEKFNVLKTKEHQNSEVGISQCILNDLKEEHDVFVCEMGAYNRGGIKLLCDIAKPKIGILTGINEQHMATFGSQENIIKTKFELIESLPSDGTAFFNVNNKYCRELYEKTKIKKYFYGSDAKIFGQENLLGAIAVAKELGMTDAEISLPCQKIGSKIPGIEIKRGVNGLTVFDATYSANPDGVISHLEYLKMREGKKIIVMPCLIELGRASEHVHRRIGKKIGEVCDLAIITTGDRFKEIKDGAGEKALFIENPKGIFEKINEFCREGDVVLLESRVPTQLIQYLTNGNI